MLSPNVDCKCPGPPKHTRGQRWQGHAGTRVLWGPLAGLAIHALMGHSRTRPGLETGGVGRSRLVLTVARDGALSASPALRSGGLAELPFASLPALSRSELWLPRRCFGFAS